MSPVEIFAHLAKTLEMMEKYHGEEGNMLHLLLSNEAIPEVFYIQQDQENGGFYVEYLEAGTHKKLLYEKIASPTSYFKSQGPDSLVHNLLKRGIEINLLYGPYSLVTITC